MGKSGRESEGGGSKKRSSKSGDGPDKPKKEKKRRSEVSFAELPTAAAAGEGGDAPAPLAAEPAEAELQAAAGSHEPDAPTTQQDGNVTDDIIQAAGAPPSAAGAGPAAATPGVAAAGAAADGRTADGGAGAKKAGKPAPVLPWMRVPIAIEASEGVLLEEVRGLDPRLKRALEGGGVEVLFPVQTVVWHETAGGTSSAHDICICAPTGSGKTLSYALPILQALSGRAVRHLRALAVLPTRDLAAQVFGVLSTLCPALGLTACLAAGRVALATEAELLAAGDIDVLVATPGRLIAHLEGTPGFTLHHLRFLVVDETDRLLRQAYQGWLPKVMAALRAAPVVPPAAALAGQEAWGGGSGGGGGGGSAHTSVATAASWVEAARRGHSQAAGQPLHRQQPSQQLQEREGPHQWEVQEQGLGQGRRVVKFVVSATLTRDPSKIDRLELYCPRYIAMSAVDHRYKLPRSLQELKLVVPAERKPAALAALLQELRGQQTIVFTSSIEATHRLALLLAALRCLPKTVVEFSSMLAPPQRAVHLEAFRSGAAKVLVCSDAMTRGMDVAGVHNVINYDAPVYVKTYVHRAGRTARAGRSGRVFTLLRHEDVRHFKDMLRKADNTFVKDHRLPKGALEAVRDDVDAALEAMAAALVSEGQVQRPGAGVGMGPPPASGQAAEVGADQQAPQPHGQQQQQETQQKRSSSKPAKRRRVAGVPEFTLLAAGS